MEAAKVQRRNAEAMAQRLHGVGLAIARRSDKKDTTLPGNPISGVDLAPGEEPGHIVAQPLLYPRSGDKIVEGSGADRLIERAVLAPLALFEDENFAVRCRGPLANRTEKGFQPRLVLVRSCCLRLPRHVATGTHTVAAVWKRYLEELLAASGG